MHGGEPIVNTAIRWSGLLLIGGAVLFEVALLFASTTTDTTGQLPPVTNVLLFLSSVLLLLSLPAMYARQANAARWLGLVGHALLQTGILLFVVVSAPPLLYSSFDLPFENSLTAFLLGIALTLGLLVTGIATVQAGVFPRGAGILLLIGTAGFFFSFFIAELLPPAAGQLVGGIMNLFLALSLAWIGFSMWNGERKPVHSAGGKQYDAQHP